VIWPLNSHHKTKARSCQLGQLAAGSFSPQFSMKL
jgi:hypothetical protein